MQAAGWNDDHGTTTLMNGKWLDTFFVIKIVEVRVGEEKLLLVNRLSRPCKDVLIDLGSILACKGDPFSFSVSAYVECICYIPMESGGSHTVPVPVGGINLWTWKSP